MDATVGTGTISEIHAATALPSGKDLGVLAYIRQQGLLFAALSQFRKPELEGRQQLYRQLADRVGDPLQLSRELQGTTAWA